LTPRNTLAVLAFYHDLPELLDLSPMKGLGYGAQRALRWGRRKSVKLLTPTASCPLSFTAA
jgi:hypothetical protein